jgi:cell wall-associated NlpC family hydrolase
MGDAAPADGVGVEPAMAPGLTAAAQRVAELRLLVDRTLNPTATPASGFDAALGEALSATGATAPAAAATVATPAVASTAPTSAVGAPSAAAAQRVATAAAEVGVREEPPGSNDGARIAEYRTATQGAGVGPWCAYFVSWVGARSGTPLGPGGTGQGWVPAVQEWLEREGRWVTPSQGVARPGDLVIFDRDGDGTTDHIGLVESVEPDGRVHTIEGNSSDAVNRRSYAPGEVAGYGRLP